MSRGFEDGAGSPGQFGASATVEIDPRSVGRVSIAYNPRTDGDADPGEIVWTWVPYEENDGRGKDRPVLVIATEPGGTVLAMQLTSKPHDDEYDVAIGSGAWDSAGRPSWVRLERVFRLHQEGMRREAVALDAPRFAAVAAALRARFGWTVAATAAAPAAAPAASPAAPVRGGASRGAAARKAPAVVRTGAPVPGGESRGAAARKAPAGTPTGAPVRDGAQRSEAARPTPASSPAVTPRSGSRIARALRRLFGAR